MQPRISCVLVSLFFALALPAVCQGKRPADEEANREVGIYWASSLIAYRELNTDGTVQDSEHGWILKGIGGKVSVPFTAFRFKNFLAQVDYSFDEGATKHWSKVLDGSGTLQYKAPFRSNDVSFDLGYRWELNSYLSLTADAEGEYRQWRRDLPQALLSIKETYTFWAPGLLVGADYKPVHRLVLGGRGGFAHTAFPTNAGIGNPEHNVPNAIMPLGSRAIYQAEAGIDYRWLRRFHTFAGIDYAHFSFGRSANVYYNNGASSEYEPTSRTDLAKLKLGGAWSF